MPLRVSSSKILIPVIGLALFIAACGGAEATVPDSPVASAPSNDEQRSTITETEARIWLVAPKGSYQTGWATMWEESGSLFVDISVSPPEAVAQPAHIHRGHCDMLGVIDHRLENVIGGKSLTELPGVTVADLATGDIAINLHLSFADFSTFTACGAVPVLPQSAPVEPETTVVPRFNEETGYDY